ncbi:hypothetical protein HGRIS_008650 [Hohenbuehelia grisea]|uniref:alpha-1,2-Mannosidase n=1 Tax=Hohenbuehelia grisea TaxID=104357 RepID=A0ABR3J8W9_9AGAR
MSNTAGLRKRNKKDANSNTPSLNKTKPENNIPRRSLISSKALYTVLTVAIAVVVYFNSAVVRSGLEYIIDQWIGFSDEWDSAPGTSSGGMVQFFADKPKQKAIVDAFQHAWVGYEMDAMGDDEYHPLSQQGSNLTSAGGIGYTVIDALDTMLIMGLDDDYKRAVDWIDRKLSFDRDANFSTFETTIRVLGGLLSAHHLSALVSHRQTQNPMLLDLAKDLADRLLTSFDTPSGLPLTYTNLGKHHGVADPEWPGLVGTAEVATLQLEMRFLSVLTDNDIYWKKAEQVMSRIKAARLPHGLASIFMSINDGIFVTSAIRLGSRADSYYEYLLKQYLQTNQTEPVYRDMYDDAMDAIHSHLVQQSPKTKLYYTAELIPEQNPAGEISWRLTPKQDHLVCFLAGSLLLGATTTGALVRPVSVPPKPEELSDKGKRDWKTGLELLKTCLRTHDTATGLAPEMVHFRIPSDGMDGSALAPDDWYIKGARPGDPAAFDARYILRPETIESLFIAYRLTGDLQYRESAWKIFQAIEKHCKVQTGGYASIINVDQVPAQQEDKMESFFLSETLKYLYLIFSGPEVLPLNQYVFNTEAHPLPIFDPVYQTGFS